MWNVSCQRNVDIEVGPPEVCDRLEAWAHRTGFQQVQASHGKWVYRRGSWRATLLYFDMRTYPTRATIEIGTAGDPGRAHCSIQCWTCFAIPTPGFSERIEDELDLLARYLCQREPARLPAPSEGAVR